MAGYSSRDKPSEGVISRLYVKALALADTDGNKVVIITADLAGNLRVFSNKVAQTIESQYDIPRSALIFNASHTHCGPEIRSASPPLYLPDESLESIQEYTNWLEKQYVNVIGRAIKNLQPAKLTFSSIRPTPFAVSRRFPTPEGIVYRSGPSSYYTGGPRDDIVPVLKVSAPDGAIKAILFGYACHPITLNEMKFCGDYPGYAQQYIEEAFPSTTAMFMQGCAGQLVPNARFQVEYAIGHGRSLADAVRFKAEFSSQFTWVSGYNNHVLGYIPTWKIQKEGGYEGGEAMRYMPYSGPFTDSVEQRVVDGVRRLVKNVMK